MPVTWFDRVLPTQWIIPIAMGAWAVWTWSQNYDESRKRERAMMAALYANPFLSACEDLQSRIYHILELRGIRSLGDRYSDGSYAEEILYPIVRLETKEGFSLFPGERKKCSRLEGGGIASGSPQVAASAA